MDAWEKRQQLYFRLFHLFEKYEELSIEQIRSLLGKDNISFTEEGLFDVFYDIYCKSGCLIRNDYWSGESTYKFLDRYFWDSSYSKHYYDFKVDDNEDKEFILISDTHIGNSKLESFSLIEGVYDYAVKRKVPKVFHLGDIFSGNLGNGFNKEEMMRQLNLFLEKYPDTSNDGVMTIACLGNHDEWIHGFFNKMKYAHNPLEALYDLRGLGEYNHSFSVIPRECFSADFSDKKVHFAHRLFYSIMIKDFHLSKIEDLANHEGFFEDDIYDVLFSGHLHKGMIYTTALRNYEKEKLYLGVPSLSVINANGLVAYKVRLNYENDSLNNMEITLLNDIGNGKITEGEIIPWSFKEKNKVKKKNT